MRQLRLKAGLLAFPFAAGFLLFYIIPFLGSVLYSFFTTTRLTDFVLFKNYADVLGNKFYLLAFGNTMRFSGVAVPLLVVFAVLLSLLLYALFERLPGAKSAFLIPLLMPSAALVAFWNMLFIQGLGIGTGDAAQLLGNVDPILPVVIFFLWKNAGICALILCSRIMAIPTEIYEAAQMDGASSFRIHFHITLPIIVPAIFFTIIFGLVQSFKVYKEVFLLYGAHPTNSLYFMQHYVNNKFRKLDYPSLSAGSVIFAAGLLAVVGIIFLCYRLTAKRR